MFFWVLVLCGLASRCQSFGEASCLHLQDWSVQITSQEDNIYIRYQLTLPSPDPICHPCFHEKIKLDWQSVKIMESALYLNLLIKLPQFSVIKCPTTSVGQREQVIKNRNKKHNYRSVMVKHSGNTAHSVFSIFTKQNTYTRNRI